MTLRVGSFVLLATAIAAMGPSPLGAAKPGRPATRPGPTTLPSRIDVVPVFFIPYGQRVPTDKQVDKLRRHVEWARDRYAELLPGHITFTLADGPPLRVRSKQTLAFYRRQPASGVPAIMSDLLADQKFTRDTCPHIYVTVVMNAKDEFPKPGGLPFNGGFNTGGGGLVVSSREFDDSPNIQSTLQHELGHTFGLPHVDTYGMDMQTSPSLMSYNPAHHTDHFTPSRTPGVLIPEDLRGLALNERVFPTLKDQPMPLPDGYRLKPLVKLGPMEFPR